MSYLAQEIVDALPGFLASVISADTYFDDVPVIIIDPTDTQQRMIAKMGAMQTKIDTAGVALFILPVQAAVDEFDQVPDGPMKLSIGFQAWEMTERKEMVNNSAKSAWQIARRVACMMKLRIFNGLVKCLVSATPCIEAAVPPDDVKLRGWHVGFTALEDDPLVVSKVALPTLTPASGAGTTVTIACATGGASIYYTTDGSAPSKLNGTLYTAPVAIPSAGMTLFAQAVLDASFPSDLKSAIFTHS